ncbi:unnamed protein product [Staphylococcus haemolyticus JCSC1435]|uniref:Uncharacterized protein n=1 Tax=Staphylococcus haemolyticus (strain JCSC1435) TaxID=279808 RepID=Q4L9N2_STAHJ|nr:unnamed protein product [Staphylococcus haemolyticus JCSC1435]
MMNLSAMTYQERVSTYLSNHLSKNTFTKQKAFE